MASSDSPPIVSPAGIIHVLGYTPTEGERGVPITVRIHFHPDLADAMYVRLVVGNKAVPTKVRQLPAVSYGRWQLYAAAPPFDRAHCASTKVLISVQALNEDNDILDSVTFGEFSYWAPGSHERRASAASSTDPAAPTSSNKPPRLQIADGPALRRRANTAASTAPVADRSPFASSPQQRKTRLHRRMKSQSLMRTKHAGGSPDEVFAQTPVLELVTPLASICADWTTAESAAGRRLVRFTKIQDGRRLIVSCEPIPQDEFNEAEAVISCIYRAENDACYVTSVDVIYLLERLTNGEFPVEEKNRIRRNLEGLRPTTVSKHKSGYGDFFQRIMEFPDPKPRNIEKDLKVFDWNLLGQALEKILSKYSIYTTGSDTDDAPGPVAGGGGGTDTTPSSGSAGASSPELFALQLSYPAPDNTTTSRFLDQQLQSAAAVDALGHPAIKFEPYAGDFAVLAANGVAHSAGSGGSAADNVTDPAFASPVDSVLTAASSSSTASSCAPFPLFAGADLGGGTGGGAVGDAHGGEYNPWAGVGIPFGLGKSAADATGGMTQDNYSLLAAAYENNTAAAIAGGAAGVGGGGSQMHTFEGNPALDFDLYETYTFPGLMSDDTLAAAGLGEHQYL